MTRTQGCHLGICPSGSLDFSQVSGSRKRQSPGSAVARRACISQTRSPVWPVYRCCRCSFKYAPRSLEPTGSRLHFQSPQLYLPAFVCVPAAARPCNYLSARRAGTGLSETARHTTLQVPPATGSQHLGLEQWLRRDSTVHVSWPGLNLDKPGVDQFVPAGLSGRANRENEAASSSRKARTRSGPPCPPLHPSSVHVSSVFVSGAVAACVGKETETLAVIPTVLLPGPVVPACP